MTDVPVAAPAVPAAAVEPSLHRVIRPWLRLLFIVGDILGTGIYSLTGQVAEQVGGGGRCSSLRRDMGVPSP